MTGTNLKIIGVSIVLLIGGEPFVRRDIPGIVRTFQSEGIYMRLQTNGMATREAMQALRAPVTKECRGFQRLDKDWGSMAN